MPHLVKFLKISHLLWCVCVCVLRGGGGGAGEGDVCIMCIVCDFTVYFYLLLTL